MKIGLQGIALEAPADAVTADWNVASQSTPNTPVQWHSKAAPRLIWVNPGFRHSVYLIADSYDKPPP